MDERFDQIAERIVMENLNDLPEDQQKTLTKIIEDELHAAYSRGAEAGFYDCYRELSP